MATGIGHRIRVLRESLEWTQRELASRLGISQSVLVSYEAGNSVPGGAALEALCTLGVDGNWLLIGDGPMWRGGGTPSRAARKRSAAPTESSESPEGGVAVTPLRRTRGRPRSDGRLSKEKAERAWLNAIHLLERFGQTELARLVVAVDQRLEIQIERCLDEESDSLSLVELTKVLELNGCLPQPEELVSVLKKLEQQGAVEVVKGRAGMRYRGGRKGTTLTANTEEERIALIVDTVHKLTSKILPACLVVPRQGTLINVCAHVQPGEGASGVAAFRDALKAAFDAIHQEGAPERVQLVFGAAY